MKPWDESLRRMMQAKDETNAAAVWLGKSIEAFDAMASVLLAIEWEGGDEIAWCPSCKGLEHALSDTPAGHVPDCVLDAALRKAGVRVGGPDTGP